MFYEVMVAKTGGNEGVFTYEYRPGSGDKDTGGLDSLAVGQIVEVPLRNGKTVGVVLKKVARPDFKTREISRIIYSKPLPQHLVQVAKFISEYYLAPLPTCVGLILPKGVEKQRRGAAKTAVVSEKTGATKKPNKTEQTARTTAATAEKTEQKSPSIEIKLNQAQKNALQSLQNAPGATKLLFGVTGSGKTNIYLKRAEKALKSQKSVVLLVPEIALTGQLVRVFTEVFGEKVTLIHSKQTEVERHQIFEKILFSEGPQIVIGPRSALFAPLDNLGLIIVDEEHEATYSQESAPKYSAIRVASVMATAVDGECILGSATPSVADYYLATARKSLATLDQKAKTTAKKAEIEVVSFKERAKFSKNRYFCDDLLKAIRRNLKQGQQTLIFHNRRGSAPLTLCENCGEELLCPQCFLPLTLHADYYVLQCHTCGHSAPVPKNCPRCGAPGIMHKGFGTKLLEKELTRLFPGARVARFDADNKKGESLEALYDDVREGKVDILVGTQTVAKGLDLPRLATVGVVQADAGMSLPDFAAEERTFQLLTQVIGRVGRGHLDTAEVFIQTFRPEHPVIKAAVAENYAEFYKYTLRRRRITKYPPFTFVAAMSATGSTEPIAMHKGRQLANELLTVDPTLMVSPPMPAFHEHTARGYTWQVVARAKSRRQLAKAVTEVLKLGKGYHATLDPTSLL